MSSRKLLKLALILICTLVAVGDANAETDCDVVTGPPPNVCRHQDFQIGPFVVKVSFNSEKAYVGNGYLDLNITAQSPPSGQTFEITKCESIPEPKISCDPEPGDTRPETQGALVVSRYKYRVAIGQGVEPKPYDLTFIFALDGKPQPPRTMRLEVGVTKDGKVRIVTDLKQTPNVFTGQQNTLPFTLINDYSNYPVTIQSISVKSDPAGLIENVTIPMSQKIEYEGQQVTVPITFKAAPMSFSSLLSGFGTSQLVLTVVYDDGYGRTVSNLKQSFDIQVRPRDRILILSMFLGVLAGALVKYYLQRLQQSGQITRRQVLGFVFSTMAIGFVVALIAMVGKIQIIAFDAKGSYDKPLVIFAIALAGAVGGAQIISSWIKKA